MSATVTSTRPTIDVADTQPEMLNALIREVTICEGQGGLVRAEMRFDNTAEHDGVGIDFAFEYSDTDVLRLGTELRVLFPGRDPETDEDIPREVFAGRVSAIEFVGTANGNAEMVVMAEDHLMPWRMRRRTRALEGKPLKDLIKDLAKDAKMPDPVLDFLSNEVVTRHQVDETDLSFLRRLLTDWDADVQVADGKLTVAPRADIERGVVALSYGTTLEQVRIVADLAHQRGRFSLSAYDHIQGNPILAEMTTTALGPGEGRNGPEYLEQFGTTMFHQSAAPVTTNDEAQALIDAYGARQSRRFVTACGVARGNPEIRVGTHLEIDGVGGRFSNIYYATSTRHHYGRSTGYITEFEAECAFFKGELAA